ncbi:MAG: hypothetical protein BWY21_00350 [Parcubacteria group bacterium ADurb.Bin216]|nr:MAG: hypothetical protein BWY21_00350 [Parcubacteria group bacterium ADurb.Bin216]
MAKKNRPGKGKGKGKPARDPQRAALEALYGKTGVGAGNALINKFLQPGALGRVDTTLEGGSLDRYKGLETKYGTRDPMQDEVLGRMKAGLGGYTSPEYQAQREQMQRGIEGNTATGMAQLAKAQARGKVYGAAGVAQQQNLLRGAQQTKDQLEQDLYVKNIDEMSRRNLEYGQYGRGLTEEEFARQNELNRGFSDEESRLREEQLERQKINLGQANAETAAQIGAFTGAGGTAIAKEKDREAQRIQREGIRLLGGGGGTTRDRARRRASRR